MYNLPDYVHNAAKYFMKETYSFRKKMYSNGILIISLIIAKEVIISTISMVIVHLLVKMLHLITDLLGKQISDPTKP